MMIILISYIFKSLLGGIGRGGAKEKQLLVMRQIKKSLKKDGECLLIENMAGTILHQILGIGMALVKMIGIIQVLKNFIKCQIFLRM